MLPGSIDALADALAETVTSVSIDVLHGIEGAGDDFRAYPEATSQEWQVSRARELMSALEARKVVVWRGELPAALQ
jgi:hypothetical protein